MRFTEAAPRVEILGLIIGWLLLSIAAGYYAERLRRSNFGWFFVSLITSPLIAFAFLFALGSRRDGHEEDEPDAGDARTPCPYRAELIKPEAIRCPFCRTDLPPDRATERLAPRRPR